MDTCYIGIGSNLGDRQRNIKLAVKKIKALGDTRVIKVSRLIETKPVGGPAGQSNFLNGALKIKTNFPPKRLLKKLKIIEQELGRIRTIRNGPRTIDLDILFYGDRVINTKELIIPHPRMFKREFVMKPLLEII